ncbi:MAG: acetyl-CoA acetyltransferase [Gammaproteobacteria bacterium]|nr:acetyl-CoA acetyltransferase [Gammaproteobacteria bacterium]
MDSERTPVLVGIGTAMQREDDWTRAREPLALMLDAVYTAVRDSGAHDILAGAGYIAVPQGRWRYRNPAGAIARAVGATAATRVLASVGVLQQSLIGDACARIARGETHTALVVGGDCGYRLLRARIAGAWTVDSEQDDAPDLHLAPKEDLFHPVETALGVTMPIGLYAIIESAWRHGRGLSLDQHRARLGEMYAGFSAIAADNPHAWQREPRTAAAIREASVGNPMQAFPYTRALCSTFNVDQAGALVFCSAARARALGIAPSRWAYPVASTESNHQVPVSARAELVRCPGAAIAGRAALAAAALAVDDVALLDLYSCFPAAVEIYAEELGIPLERSLTVTGSMAYAGGPWNNYVLQATSRAVELMRAGHGANALISSVSGMLTKQAFGLYATAPPPHGFVNADVSADTARAQRTVEVVADYHGAGRLAGYTVIHERDRAPSILALVDTDDGRRALAGGDDPALIARLEREEWVGRPVRVAERLLCPA